MLKKTLNDGFILLRLISKGFSPSVARELVSLARLETGHYTSNAFLNHNNAFGMGVVQTRPTTQIGGHANADVGIGHYRNLLASVDDMSLYFDYFGYDRNELSKTFWTTYNPKASYRDSVLRTANQATLGASLILFVAPLVALTLIKIL